MATTKLNKITSGYNFITLSWQRYIVVVVMRTTGNQDKGSLRRKVTKDGRQSGWRMIKKGGKIRLIE